MSVATTPLFRRLVLSLLASSRVKDPLGIHFLLVETHDLPPAPAAALLLREVRLQVPERVVHRRKLRPQSRPLPTEARQVIQVRFGIHPTALVAGPATEELVHSSLQLVALQPITGSEHVPDYISAFLESPLGDLLHLRLDLIRSYALQVFRLDQALAMLADSLLGLGGDNSLRQSPVLS